MKKILIAVLCVIPLCLTSCASAPEEVAQETPPQIEAADTTETPDSEENGNSEDNIQDDSDEQIPVEEDIEETEKSEILPEPEAFIEPEVITLEPEDEIIPSETEPVSEEVEKEEPPEILTADEIDSSETENKADEALAVEEAQNENDDETADTVADIVIEEKSSYSEADEITGGIDITDDENDSKTQLREAEKHIIPSRSVTLKKFEYLDVTYPGTGWIYMGLTDNSKDLAYFGRKLGTKDTKFSLQARTAGRKIIHFYKNDPLTGNYLDDYIEVIITAENGSNKTHIEAPEYKLPVQKKEKQTETNPEEIVETEENNESSATSETKSPATAAAAETKTISESKSTSGTTTSTTDTKSATSVGSSSSAASTVSSSSASTTSEKSKRSESSTTSVSSTVSDTSKAAENTSSETQNEVSASSQSTAAAASNPLSLLQEAQLLYNEKEYKAALSKLNSFFELSTDRRDEALYLKGQILEAKSDIRDIKGSLEAYSSLTKNYPASNLWESANKRIIYLKRFYLEVR